VILIWVEREVNEEVTEICKYIVEAINLRNTYVSDSYEIWDADEKNVSGHAPFSPFNCEIPGLAEVLLPTY
jgi:hypothetical protein